MDATKSYHAVSHIIFGMFIGEKLNRSFFWMRVEGKMKVGRGGTGDLYIYAGGAYVTQRDMSHLGSW